MKKETKYEIFISCIGVAGTIAAAVIGNIYGTEKQNEYIQSQVASVTGDGNTVNINDVDDLVKDYNQVLEENETLKEQNKEYFENGKEAKNTIDNLEEQLGDTPTIEVKSLGLCIDGDDININKTNSYAIIDGTEYFSRDVIDNLISDDMNFEIEEDTMFFGKIIAEKDSLFSQQIIDSYAYNVNDNLKDSRGNVHSNAVKLNSDSIVTYNLDNQYSLLRLKIAVADSSKRNGESVITITADDKIVYTSPTLNKIETEEIECNDININNCSRLEIRCSNNGTIYPIIYDAEVYN